MQPVKHATSLSDPHEIRYRPGTPAYKQGPEMLSITAVQIILFCYSYLDWRNPGLADGAIYSLQALPFLLPANERAFHRKRLIARDVNYSEQKSYHRTLWPNGNIAASCSGGPRFKSRLGDLRFFVVFVNPSKQMPGQYLKLGHNYFLPHPFQLTTSLSSFHWTLYRLSYRESVDK
jgi:hypothetical protein